MRALKRLLVGMVILGAGHQAFAAAFTGLGDLAGGPFNSQGRAVSRDGSTIAGFGSSAASNPPNHTNFEAFRWTASDGMVPLGALSGPVFASVAYGASADGSVIVGSSLSNADQAFRWTSAGGMIGLGYLSGGTTSTAMGTSADGSVVVGFSSTTGASYEAFRWTSGSGMLGLGQLPGNVSSFRSAARAVSPDGSVITGEAFTTNYQAYRWTSATGLVPLGTLPGGAVYSVGQALSTDGNVIVGYADSPQGTQAFRWTSATGMLPLGDLPGGAFMSQAYGVSGDGSIVVGFGETASGDTAFIWDALHGIRDLKTALVTDFGLDLTGWTLNSAMGISEDGRVITGAGTDPAGQTEAFAVFVPEPGTMGGLIAAGAILISRRHRSL